MFNTKIFILIFSIVLFDCSFAVNSKESNVLEITLVSRNDTVVFGDLYWANVYLKNNGKKSIMLCDCNIIGTNYLKEISNASAKLVEDAFWTNTQLTDANFITILPGESYKFGEVGLDKNYLCSPGSWTYRIRNEFLSVKTPNGSMSWGGEATSNTVIINVVGKTINN